MEPVVGLGGFALETLVQFVLMQIGLVGGWAGMTSCSPKVSDTLSGSEIGWSLDDARVDLFNLKGTEFL